MLQKYYKQGRDRMMELHARLACIVRCACARRRIDELESWKLEEAGSWMDEVVSYKLWIDVLEVNGKRWQQEFPTARAMREAIETLDRNYVTCREIYDEHDGIGRSWKTHMGKVFDKE